VVTVGVHHRPQCCDRVCDPASGGLRRQALLTTLRTLRRDVLSVLAAHDVDLPIGCAVVLLDADDAWAQWRAIHAELPSCIRKRMACFSMSSVGSVHLGVCVPSHPLNVTVVTLREASQAARLLGEPAAGAFGFGEP
jgi:hypothetical protein